MIWRACGFLPGELTQAEVTYIHFILTLQKYNPNLNKFRLLKVFVCFIKSYKIHMLSFYIRETLGNKKMLDSIDIAAQMKGDLKCLHLAAFFWQFGISSGLLRELFVWETSWTVLAKIYLGDFWKTHKGNNRTFFGFFPVFTPLGVG